MGSDERAEIAFPVSADGRRSTSAAGQAVVAGALAQVDPAGAESARHETDWRARYPAHLRRLIETGLASQDAAVTLARDGLAALYEQMRLTHPDGTETGLDALVTAGAQGSRLPSPSPAMAPPSASCRFPTAASGCVAARCWTGRMPGSPAASSSRRAPRRSGPSRRTPAGRAARSHDGGARGRR